MRRDTTLLRFLHSTLISAPQLVIQLYAIMLALSPTDSIFDPVSPPILAAAGLCILSLVYAITAFTTNDRLSGKNRRVILPAHILQSLWYLCTMASRVTALAVFAYVHGYWVYVLVAGHWILMLLLLFIQRTTFCADIELQPSASGSPPERTYKRRWSLEIPFYLITATVYIFTFFNMKHEKSRYWVTLFHLLMFAENVTMGVLFFVRHSSLIYAQAALVIVVGLYPLGMLFMVVYYLFCHPKSTKRWYWVGIPRKIKCCCTGSKRGEATIGGFRNHSSVVISGPTLISHNGYLPDNMLPVGVPTSPLPEGISEAMGHTAHEGNTTAQNSSSSSSRRATDGGSARAGQQQEVGNETSSPAIVSPNSRNANNSYMAPHSATTTSESNTAFSDIHSQFVPSDTDMDSNVVLEEEHVDTVIDTPLVGFTPEPFDVHAVQMLRHDRRTKSVESQRTDTVDTGIELESDDVALTPGTTTASRPEDVHHRFIDIPAKRKDYFSERSRLEQHYFPEVTEAQQ